MNQTTIRRPDPVAAAGDEGAAPAEPLAAHEERPDIDASWAAHRAEMARRRTQLGRDARAVFRAMEGWDTHGNLEEDWVKTCQRSAEHYDSGRFLLERLGAERFMDPTLMATIWGLRQRLIEELGATTAAQAMLIDCAVLGYYNTLRVQGWIGNLALHIEHEFFARESPSAKFKKEYGTSAVAGLQVEDTLQRLTEQMLPLLDRANRLLIRNLKAVRELRQGPTEQPPIPSVSIGSASQVNVGGVQQNVVADTPVEGERGEARLVEVEARRNTPGA